MSDENVKNLNSVKIECSLLACMNDVRTPPVSAGSPPAPIVPAAVGPPSVSPQGIGGVVEGSTCRGCIELDDKCVGFVFDRCWSQVLTGVARPVDTPDEVARWAR